MIRSLTAPPRSAFERGPSLARLADETFDVVVIGGGITGAGVALDAAARGLRTALVERADFASGTSSRSSKLVHGGLRYLQQGEFALVYEALAERQRLLANAPHLVTAVPFLIPLFGQPKRAHLYSVALWQYDLTGGLRIGKRHRRIGADEAQSLLPTLDLERLDAGFIYWDAHADDARLTLAILRTAVVNFGAVAANYAPVAGLLRRAPGGSTTGDLVGVRLEDGTEIRAAAVVNASGVWSDAVRNLDRLGNLGTGGGGGHGGLGTGGGGGEATLRPAKGVHLTFRADRLPATAAAVLPVPGDQRSIFVVPWNGFTYVGTTDTDYQGPLEDPPCTPQDVDYLLGALNASLTRPLSRADVTSSWAGLRPLVRSAKNQRTADLSRRHRVSVSPDGLISVTGGKLTTYRRMAADAVDKAVERLGRGSRHSPTKHLMLLGGIGSDGLHRGVAASRLGVDAATLAHLTGRYGTEARTVIAITEADPELARPLVTGLPYLRAEAVYAARYEMAHTLEDVLARRTRCLFLARDAAAAAAGEVARLIAPELGWSARRSEREASGFRKAARQARDAAGLGPAAASAAAASPAAASAAAASPAPASAAPEAPHEELRWR